jgi:hypothetical protein|tara:strand:- start:162 stop:359 length:198 start_codon:yes stop_codon:yes gene_type:complete
MTSNPNLNTIQAWYLVFDPSKNSSLHYCKGYLTNVACSQQRRIRVEDSCLIVSIDVEAMHIVDGA